MLLDSYFSVLKNVIFHNLWRAKLWRKEGGSSMGRGARDTGVCNNKVFIINQQEER